MDTLAEKGWSEKSNGELIDLAETEGYQVLVTTDQSMRYQQNISSKKLGIVILFSANWPQVRRYVSEIAEAVTAVQPGTFIEVPIGVI